MSIKVESLHIYPIKSCRGIDLQSMPLTSIGPEHDRRWVVVREIDGIFLTQRQKKQMALFETAIERETLHVSVNGNSVRVPISADVYSKGSAIRSIKVWTDQCDGFDCGDEAAQFFSEHLQERCRLVRYGSVTNRQVNLNYSQPGDQVAFADSFPLLLTSVTSLGDLNARLGLQAVPMNRFRPNIVVSGVPEAFEEDLWKEVDINGVTFRVAKACTRCVITTTDQHTGQRSAEPLATLAKYRTLGKKIIFGQNLINNTKGAVQVGDILTIRT